MDKEELWQVTLAKVELNLSRPSFLTWFQGTGIASIDSGKVIVSAPNGFAKEWLQNKYHKAILHAMREISSDIREISYVVGKYATLGQPTHSPDTRKKVLHERSDETQPLKDFAVNPETNLNPRYTFANFVVGSFNELAHAAAQSVLKAPGTSYNPLFIYGGVGLGKTHLIQAIGNELAKNPLLKIRYVPSEKYMGEIVEALRNQEMGKLKERYRTIDLLIIDDVQFMARTEKMQEEFFHIFNALYEKNKQIVISSDRPPQAIATLEERLRSRFEGGMIADVGLPDYETRLVILRAKVNEKQVTLSDGVLELIADNVKNNIRELEGALNRIVMASKLSNKPFDADAAKKVLTDHLASPKKFISPKKIIKSIAAFYDIEEKDLMTHSRKKDFVKPRQIAMYLMRHELQSSYPSIGEKFGGRDHTTAIHSCEKIEQGLRTSNELQEELRAIKDKIYLEA